MKTSKMRGDDLNRKTFELSAKIERFKRIHPSRGPRVAEIAARLAPVFQLSPSEHSALRIASYLHDIGELGMGRGYKATARSLSSEEVQDLRRHPVISEQTLAGAGFDRMVQLAVRWHHEDWNGGGYPDGLRGREIPVICRILRVADAYVSLTERSARKEPLASADARLEIARLAAIAFDPLVVNAFLNLRNCEALSSIADPIPDFTNSLADETPHEGVE